MNIVTKKIRIGAGFLLLLVGLFLQPLEATAQQTLLVHLTFDQAAGTVATDVTGNGHNGTLQNMENDDWIAGKYGTGLRFDEGDEGVVIPHHPALDLGANNGDYTVAFWMKMEEEPTGEWLILFQKGLVDSERTPGMFLYPDVPQIHYVVSTDVNSNEGFEFQAQLRIGEWVHVAYKKEGHQISAYLNGMLTMSGFTRGESIANEGDIYLGATPWRNTNKIVVDDLRIYSGALDQAAINDLILSVDRLVALPPSINTGGATTLQWDATGYERVSISGGGLSNVDVTNVTSYVVNPPGTTTYTLSAEVDGTSVSKSVTVGVGGTVQAPIVSEFMAVNGLTLTDNFDDDPDWIEIYNPNPFTIDLQDYYLTDDPNDLRKWQFSSTQIVPNGYLVVYASGRDINISGEPLHTNFGLSDDGEYVGLVYPDGATIASSIGPDYPQQLSDVSYGRSSNGAIGYLSNPTPGSANGATSYTARTEATVDFSLQGGIYNSTQSVSLSSSEPGVTIRYTTDGSEPSATDPVFTSAISIAELQTIRARAFVTGEMPGPIKSESYLIGVTSTLPVISIATDPDNLWDDEIGIYVAGMNGAQGVCAKGAYLNFFQDWKRPAHVTMLEPDGTMAFESNVHFSIAGLCSRNNDVKSLDLSFRDEFGSSPISYPLFNDPYETQTTFNGIRLRNSGGEWSRLLFRDGAFQSLVHDAQLDIDHQNFRSTVVYINGEYFGVLNLRDRQNASNLEATYGIPSDEIDIVSNPGQYVQPVIFESVKGNETAYREAFDFIDNADLSDSTQYAQYANYVDIDSMLDYFTAQIYFGNRDWPGNNAKIWRERTDNGRWRWMLFDLDGGGRNAEFDSLSRVSGLNYINERQHAYTTMWFAKALDNPAFRNEYIQRNMTFMELVYSEAQAHAKIDGLSAIILPELPAQHASWPTSAHGNITAWQTGVDDLKQFFTDRPASMTQILVDHFALSGATYELTVNTPAGTQGTVSIHSSEMAVPLGYTGTYMADVPVRLNAMPQPGHRFVRWAETGETTPTIMLTASADTVRTPVFEAHGAVASVSNLVISEIHYHPSDDLTPEFIELRNLSDQPVDLSGLQFVNGVAFTFPLATPLLGPNESVVIFADEALFAAQYMDAGSPHYRSGLAAGMAFGPYEGALKNGGEQIEVVGFDGSPILSVDYDDEGTWPLQADGNGSSLELNNLSAVPLSQPARDLYLNDGANWRPSIALHGTPGVSTLVPIGDVNCDGLVNVVDALFIMQREVQLRTDSGTCPTTDTDMTLLHQVGDVNADTNVNVIDALTIMQCDAQIANSLCP